MIKSVEDHFVEKIVSAVLANDAFAKIQFPPRYVYLAGPILGCTLGEANDWRKYVADKLRPHNIIGVSPLRCEPIIGDTYSAEYPDPRFGTPRAIAAKNRFDVRTCDMTLAVLPLPVGKPQSYGTIGECFWADEGAKQVILCTNDPFVSRHPVIDSAVDWKLVTADCPGGDPNFKTLEDTFNAAIEICVGVLGGYTGGKNV